MTIKVAVLSFSNISADARVLRQVEFLLPHYAVAVIGYGERLPPPLASASFYPVPRSGDLPLKLRRLAYRAIGWKFPRPAFERLAWSKPESRQALSILLEIKPKIIHANELETLLVAVRAAEALNARIILDLHEYSPLEMEDSLFWKPLYQPYVEYLLKRYIPSVFASVTVGEAIANRYADEYGFRPLTVINAPALDRSVDFRPAQADRIRLVHHGGALPMRRLEWMIQTLTFTDARYSLHFMLTGDSAYQKKLKSIAEKLAPGRVFFHSPVAPAEIVAALHQFDMGFYLLHTRNYNNASALPNKFFDFIQAGLGVCVGPSPEMARLIRQYGFGLSADSFEPRAVAERLNQLTAADVDRFKQAALEARAVLCADVEMKKMLSLYEKAAS